MTTVADEVSQRLGLVPNFFRLAPQDPEINEWMWGFAKFAYLDNPLPSLFKERLFVWLSRFCEVRYCIARHVCFLAGLGHPAGDAGSPTQPVDEIVRLLTKPVPRGASLRAHIGYCSSNEHSIQELAAPDSEAEWAVFACATEVFTNQPAHHECMEALHRAFGPARIEYLLLLLAFIRTAHCWTTLHPRIPMEDDLKHLLDTHARLSQCILEDPEAGSSEPGRQLLAEVASLREEKQRLARESAARLDEDIASSHLLHNISNELIGEQCIEGLYGKLIDVAARLVHASGGSMQLLATASDGAPELRLLAYRWLTPEAAKFWQHVRLGAATTCGNTLASGHRTVVPDVDRCQFMAGTKDLVMYRQAGVRAAQTTPLYSRGGALLGTLSTYWREPREPSEHELAMLDILARQAADLVERTKVEEALRASEERLHRVLQPHNVGVIFFNADGRITEANDTFLRMSGYTRPDLSAGKLRWDEMTPPEWMPATMRAMEELKQQGWSAPYEKEYLRKDGSHWWGLLAGTQVSETEAVEFVIDVTDRKRVEQALKDTDRRKDVFLATLAHELRNPLAPISNAVRLLSRANGRRKPDRLVAMMDRQVHLMVRLVDDLLEVSRIAGGKVGLAKGRVALADIVNDAVETSRPLIEQAHHALCVSLPAEPVELDADSVRLTQVLANLLNNAARYTDPGGHIWLTARCDHEVVIAVRDDGIGIAPDQLSHIFDLFAQARLSQGRNDGGLGMGLTVARSLAEMHGGSIEAHSAGLGLGSEFIVHLPLPAATAG